MDILWELWIFCYLFLDKHLWHVFDILLCHYSLVHSELLNSHLWVKYICLKIICIWLEYLIPYRCKLFVLSIVTGSFNCLLKIIISLIASDLTDKMKRSFFQAAVTSILLYGCTTWTLTKRLEKKLDGNYTRMLRAILNKSWRQQPTRHQLYGYLPPITKTIQVRRTRHTGHCWRSRDELIRDVLLWTPTPGRAKAGRPAWTYIQQLCEDMGCCPEDLPRVMNDRKEWWERVRDIRATSAIWWWWLSVTWNQIIVHKQMTIIK